LVFFLTGRIVKCLDKEALDRVIVETNPGFGVVTSALLNAGATDVRVLEHQTDWKSKFEVKSSSTCHTAEQNNSITALNSIFLKWFPIMYGYIRSKLVGESVVSWLHAQ